MNKFMSSCIQCNDTFFIKDPYNPLQSRVPQLLPCGQSACSRCVTHSLSSSDKICCKHCNATFSSEKAFPINLFLMGSIIDLQNNREKIDENTIRLVPTTSVTSKTATSNKSSKIRICCECTLQPASCQCDKCNDVYCSPCFTKVHCVGRSLKQHRKIFMSESVTDSCKLTMCVEHPETPCNIFCENDNVVVCPTCAIAEHNGHCLVQIIEKNQKLIPEMKTATIVAAKVLKNLAGAQKTLQKITPCADSEQLKQTKKELAQYFILFHSLLQLKEHSLIDQLECSHLSSLQNTNTMVTEIRDQVLQLQELLHDAHTAQETQMLPNVDLTKILEKLNGIVNLPCKLKLPEENNALSARFESGDLKTLLKENCKLYIEQPTLPTLIPLLPGELDAVDEESSTDEEVQAVEGSSDSNSDASKRVLNVLGRGKHEPFQPANLNNRSMGVKSYSLSSKSSIKSEYSTTEVIVLSHLETPGSFYVQRVKDLDQIRQLVKGIKIAAPTCTTCPDPIPGNLYLVKYDQDEAWYRGRVTKVCRDENNENIAEVFYVDYGNCSVVKTSMIKMLPASLSYVYPLCIHCTLANIEPEGGTWSSEAIATFLEMVSSPKVEMIVKSREGSVIEVDLLLKNTDNVSNCHPQSVRDTLLFLDLGHLKTPLPLPDRVFQQQRQFLTMHLDLRISSSHNVMVSHVDSPHCFYVQRLGESANHLKKMVAKLNTFYNSDKNNLKVYSPQIGMQCAAKYPHDGCWYRAKVIGLPEKRKITVLYVDYGNRGTVDWFNVKKLHDDFTQFDAQAICCKLSDVVMDVDQNTWPPGASHKLQSLTYQKELRMVVDQRGQQIFDVTLYEVIENNEYCINSKLANAGFGRYKKGKSANAQVRKRANIEDSTAMQTNKMIGQETFQPVVRRNHLSPIRAILGPSLLSSSPPKTFTNQPSTSNVMQPSTSYELQPSTSNTLQPTTSNVPTMPLKNYSPTKIGEPHRFQVQVLSHNTPGEIYIKLLRQQEELDNMMQKMQEFYNKEKILEDNEWKIGDSCVVLRATDNHWFRAIIIDIQDTVSKVFLVDLAEALQLQTCQLRSLDSEFTQQIHGALKCHLAGIKAAGDRPDLWPLMAGELLTELLQSYQETYITKKGDIEKGSLPIDLWVENLKDNGALNPIVTSWVTINQMLVDNGVALPIKSPEPMNETSDKVLEDLKVFRGQNPSKPSPEYWKKLLKSEFSPDTLETVKKLLESTEETIDDSTALDWPKAELPSKLHFEAVASYVDDECFIYLQELPKSEHALNKMTRVVQQNYTDSKPKVEKWSPGEMCMALYHTDDKWYRGKIVKVPENAGEDLTVLFVDFGNCEQVSPLGLHKAAHLNSIPVQCFKCCLVTIAPRGEDGVWPTEYLDLLHGIIVDKKCEVTLLDLPQQGEPVKVLKLMTELGRDVVEYMCSSKLCKRVPIATLNSNDIHSGIENISEEINSAAASIAGTVINASLHNCSELSTNVIQDTPENGIMNRKINKDLDSSCEAMEVEVTDVKIETGPETETKTEDIYHIPIQLAIEEEPLPDQTIIKNEAELTPISSNNDSNLEVVTLSDSSSDESTPSEDEESSNKTSENEQELFNYSHFNVKEGTMFDAEVVVVISAVEIFLKPVKSHMINSKVPPKKDPLAALQKEMRKNAPKQPLLQNVVPGLPCCCCYIAEDDWYRAIVLEVDKVKSTAVISFVDFGNKEEITMSKLHCIKPEWMGLPTQALHCKVDGVKILENVDTNVLQTGVRDALLSGPVVIKFKTIEKPYVVELLQTDRETSVYQNMVDQNIAEFVQ